MLKNVKDLAEVFLSLSGWTGKISEVVQLNSATEKGGQNEAGSCAVALAFQHRFPGETVKSPSKSLQSERTSASYLAILGDGPREEGPGALERSKWSDSQSCWFLGLYWSFSFNITWCSPNWINSFYIVWTGNWLAETSSTYSDQIPVNKAISNKKPGAFFWLHF